jgi:hypothetical protein
VTDSGFSSSSQDRESGMKVKKASDAKDFFMMCNNTPLELIGQIIFVTNSNSTSELRKKDIVVREVCKKLWKN